MKKAQKFDDIAGSKNQKRSTDDTVDSKAKEQAHGAAADPE